MGAAAAHHESYHPHFKVHEARRHKRKSDERKQTTTFRYIMLIMNIRILFLEVKKHFLNDDTCNDKVLTVCM